MRQYELALIMAGQYLLQLAHFAALAPNLVAGRSPGRVPGLPLLPGFQELLRPTKIEVLIDFFLPAQLSDAVLAA